MSLMIAMLSFAHDFEVDGIYYNITSSSEPYTVEVTYKGEDFYSAAYTGAVTIPESVTYDDKTYKVTRIGYEVFRGCNGLTSVTIPNTVTSIGDYALYGCNGLTSITIPNSVTSIGWGAFSGCSGLESVTIPNSVTIIGGNAFDSCNGLTSITIPNSVTSIGTGAFYGCSGLNSVIIPNSVTRIGAGAFQDCVSLLSVTIPNSITSIGRSSFSGCSGLISVTIPNSVMSIDAYAFEDCSGLTSVTIPNSVTSIGENAFSGCSGLTEITSNIQEAFATGANCWEGIDKTIPLYVKVGTKEKYQNTDGWKDFTNIIDNIPLSIGDIFTAPTAEGVDMKFRIISETEVEVYYGCIDYTYAGSITIPESVEGYKVTGIGQSAFERSSGLTSITIPNSVTNIGMGAFYNCSSLTSITIPNSVTSIGERAFRNCSGLTSIVVENGNIKYDSHDNCNAIIETASNTLIQGCKTTIIPNSVKSIGNYAFSSCGLTSVTIPNSIKSIGNYAFDECSELTSITIPNSVTTIGDGAFSGCSRLTSVTIPNGVTSIGEDAFHGCSGLTSVSIPNGVTSIGNYAFSNCYKLTSISIPNSVTTIGDYAFYYCSNLKSIVLPEGVTSIGKCSISWCDRLTSVTIPNSLTMISSYAVLTCWKMNEIISYIQEPFIIDDYCWEVDKSIPLYVPAGTKEKYQNTRGWKDFTNIIEFGGDVIEPTEEAKEVDMAAVPDQMELNGMVVGDTYYALNKDNGDGADKEDGCVVINSITTDEAVSSIVGKDISDESVKDAFKGIIFMVPAGTGKVSVTGQTIGSSSLMVKVGSQPAQAFQLAERETVQIPYTVTEPTYVYIYAGTSAQGARVQGAITAAAAENSVKVYSYKWEPTQPTGINSIHNSQFTIENEAGAWYTLDGRKLAGKPAKKGVYIHNGRKVAVK